MDSEYAWLIAMGAAIAATWGYIKTAIMRLGTLIIGYTTADGEAANTIKALAWRDMKRPSSGFRKYNVDNVFVRPLGKYSYIAMEEIPDKPLLFLWKGRPIIMQFSRPGEGEAKRLSMWYPRWWINPDDLMREAVGLWNEYMSTFGNKRRYRVQTVIGAGALAARRGGQDRTYGAEDDHPVNDFMWTRSSRIVDFDVDDIGVPFQEGEPLINIMSLPDSVMTHMDEIHHWMGAKDWYKDRCIPWRRGWMLYGPPGTGKTTLVKAMAQYLDLPVFAYDLPTLSNDEMRREWTKMLSSTPCIALIEDIDGVFNKRENVLGENSGGLTFDCLLNIISGVENADGVFFIITTNHPEKVDQALGGECEEGKITTRPGRIDRAIEMSSLSEAGRIKMAKRILDEFPDEIEKVVKDGEGDTGAQFQERCSRIAIDRFWKEKPDKHSLIYTEEDQYAGDRSAFYAHMRSTCDNSAMNEVTGREGESRAVINRSLNNGYDMVDARRVKRTI